MIEDSQAAEQHFEEAVEEPGQEREGHLEAESKESATDETPEVPSVDELLMRATAKAEENLDGWQRSVAELANARKRFNQQILDSQAKITADVVAKLLPAIDDFNRATGDVPEAVRSDPWFEGIELVYRKLLKTLDDLRVEQIESVGHEFDPNFHEALSSEESDEYESGIVCRQLLAGYKLGERVVRPSLVIVAA